MPSTELHTVDSLLTHPAVRAACAAWEEEGRCPVGFGDWLEEAGLPGSGFARWAETEPDRIVWGVKGLNQGPTPLAHYPANPGSAWFWTCQWSDDWSLYANDLPRDILLKLPLDLVRSKPGEEFSGEFPSFAHAVCAVLLVWPEGYTP